MNNEGLHPLPDTEGFAETHATNIIGQVAEEGEVKQVDNLDYDEITDEERKVLSGEILKELQPFFELEKLIHELENEKDENFKKAILELMENVLKQLPNEKPVNLVIRLKIKNGGINNSNQRKFADFAEKIPKKAAKVLGISVDGNDAGSNGTASSEKTASKELDPDFDDKLLALFEKYINLVMGKLRAAALTNIDYNSMDAEVKSAYDAYNNYYQDVKSKKDRLPSGTDTERVTKGKIERRLKKSEDLIQNIAGGWEYQFACMKNGFGLIHNVETIDIKVDPERWRRIFFDEGEGSDKDGYGLVDSKDGVGARFGIESKETFRTVKGPYWDMWDMAVQISANPQSDEEKKYTYGDDLANRMGDFYDFVINKYLKTQEGQKYIAYFKKRHGCDENSARFRLVRTQIKQMFDIGNLLDDIYAAKAIKGSSMAHKPTMVSVNGENKALWSIVYPISSAGYTVENTQAIISHTSMNLAMATEESLLDYYSLTKKKGESPVVPSGTEEIRHHTESYVDTVFDQEELLGKFDRLRGFPNFARSVLEFGLSQSDRYFNVELAGWDYLWSELFKPLGELSEHDVEEKLGAWAKQGLGRAKLVSQALSMKNFVDLTRVYYSRVFAAFEGNTEISLGRRKLVGYIPDGLVGNVSDDVQDLRYGLVRSIQERSSTISYMGIDFGGYAIKRELMKLLGADFIMSDDRYKQLTEEFASLNKELKRSGILPQRVDEIKKRKDEIDREIKEKSLETSIKKINSAAPKLLIRTFRRAEINNYVMEMSEHHKYPGLRTKVDKFKKSVSGVFAPNALADEIKPPYLLIQREKSDK